MLFLMLCLLPIAWIYAFGDPGEARQTSVHEVMKNVDLICSQFSPLTLKQTGHS